ncbi:MAG: PP2C family protein-serine/threonine phosphatase [Methylococcales bacterium]
MATKIKQQILSSLSFLPGVDLIDDAYAICDKQSLQLLYCNKAFREWFEVDSLDINIEHVFSTLRTEILLKRLAKRGAYTFSVELEHKTNWLPKLLDISFKLVNKKEQQFIAIHAHNMTKLLEKDALIHGHSRIIEKSNRQLAKLTKRLEGENLRLNAELEVTRKLQKFLLPTRQELSSVKDMDIACFMEPADEVGGDYYDVLKYDDGVLIAIGDVTGHGLESGMVMLMVQMGIRTLLANNETNPSHVLTVLNQAIIGNVARMNADKSLSLAILYCQQGKIRLTGQHEEIIVVRKGGNIECINTMDLGFPIGLVDDISRFIDDIYINLDQGDGLVLYTDGITEAENIAKQQYEIQRLCKVISQHWSKPAEAICKAVTDDVFQFIGQQNIYDDITLLVIKQK